MNKIFEYLLHRTLFLHTKSQILYNHLYLIDGLHKHNLMWGLLASKERNFYCYGNSTNMSLSCLFAFVLAFVLTMVHIIILCI
jgi:hypothetical protein